MNPLHTDDILLKYLRAKDFNLEEAERNYREVDATCKIFYVYGIADTYVPSELIQRYAGDSFLGLAKDGTVVRYITGRVDNIGFLHSMSSHDLLKYFFYVFESDLKTMREDNLKTGRNCNEITYIFDFEDCAMTDFTCKYILEAAFNYCGHLQNFYPEVWRNIFFVNVPSIIDKVFHIFKPIFRMTLLQKIQFATKSSTAELLRKYIDDNVLPAFLGGKRVDSKGDPKCREFVKCGGKIPEKYYLRNCTHFIEATDPGVKVTVIGPRSVFNIPIVVRKAGKLSIEIRTENGSIVVSILYRDFGADPENPDLPAIDEILDPRDERSNVRVMMPKVRTPCHLAPNNVYATSPKPGIYIVQLDNTSSWFGSRKFFYRMTLHLE